MKPPRDEEILQACDENGHPTGPLPRGEAHGGSFIPHMAVHVIVERPSGRLLLQKRALEKKIQPGKWDTSVGGHVAAGEDVLEAAKREMEEELGITGVEPELLYRYLWRSGMECEFVTTFRVLWDGPVHFPEEEISEVRDWSFGEIEAAPAEIFTPNFLHETAMFRRWKAEQAD